MSDTHVPTIASENNITSNQVQATVALLDEGGTVPFISRYRKEVTGGLDEVAIIAIRDRLEQLRALDKRREAILKSVEEQGKLTDELKAKFLAAETLSALEDMYLPYRPKRRTRATIAKEKGLEPLASTLFEQGEVDPMAEAAGFVDAEKEVASAEDALAGARDIIAEWVNEDADARSDIRKLYAKEAVMASKVLEGKEADGAKFKDYFEWSEPLAKAPSHRVLAVRRGENEGILSFSVRPDEQDALVLLEGRFVRGDGAAAQQVKEAVRDSYKRLMSLSMETEMRVDSKKRADEEAIRVFAENLRELLLSSPLGQKSVLAVDPGFRTGCKVVCLDRQGKLVHNDAIYPLEPQKQTDEAATKIKELVERFEVEAIAVGNGTGGREALAFCRELDLGREIPAEMVNESGASVYSASKAARDEFPDHDVTVRGSVSIGRRLVDPLAELVKIDPKSIGVGQYQHDVDQKDLKQSLDDVVVSCVNAVGVEINTASQHLLSYVSGLGPKLASNMVQHREERGPFQSRAQLLEVAGMGPKTYEQSAGFLRIREGENPLDASAVHPESYPVVEAMANDLACAVPDLIQNEDLRQRVELQKYVTDSVGMPTLTDIMEELAKPGRDPRKQFESFSFEDGVHEMTDLKPGMKLPGIVTNVTNFGAFVDIGVHQDGLVHISQLADQFVKTPSDVVKVHQKVTVTVMEVDLDRKRIALSMRSAPNEDRKPPERREPSEAERPPRERGPRRPRADKREGGDPRERRPRRRRQPKRENRDDFQMPTPAKKVEGYNNPFVKFFKDWKPKE